MAPPPYKVMYLVCVSIKPKVVFKDYDSQQMLLLPPDLSELIPASHPVRIIQRVIDGLDLAPLLKQYKGGGSSSYHPRMLLKVLVYGYLENVYSSRKLEAAVQQNIHFMWLSGMSRPDHNTINRFRSDRLKGVFKQLFGQVVQLLVEQGVVNIKQAYLDGTKIEANANRYTFVWGKAIKTNKSKIKQQLDELWEYAEGLAKAELADSSPTSYEALEPEQVEAAIDKLNEVLKDKPANKKVSQKLSYGKKNWPDKLRAYKEKEKLLAHRGSYSKTDPDATFMRMKEDHMKNGQLKPGYNLQISTNEQFILNYTIHQTTTDYSTLEPHLNQFYDLYHLLPQELCADAGYGSEENYELLKKKEIEGYVKFNYFHKEQTKKWKEDAFKPANLYYNPEQDCYYCPMGQPMKPIGQHKRTTSTGFQQTITRYQAKNCKGCPLQGSCHGQKTNRIIEVNHNLNAHKQIMRERLNSEKGLRHRSNRPQDVEAVFGAIKANRNFRRFLLRGIEKVEIEAGLLAMAHNIKKMAA